MDSCNSESFYYRSLPFSAFLSTLAHFGVRNGYLRPSLNYGSGPKAILAGTIGYFLGKASYVNVCADKFLVEAPDSHIADAVRFNRGIPTRNPNFEEDMKSRAGMSGANNPAMVGGGYQPQSPVYNNPASPTYSPQDQAASELSGYEELRRRNREGAAPGFSVPGNPYQPVSLSPPPPPPSAEAAPPSKLRPIQPQTKNKYGDE